ncbi:MAG: alpha/beta hydrolase-fold protein [Gammaproteobacteria bacterium]|nr:alpha/beta hydrolase-fold protein [Gammaproteobacteria bacterium]
MLFISLLLAGGVCSQSVSTSRGDIPVYIPDGYSESRAHPLLLLLHGYGFDGEVAESIWGFTDIIDKYEFIYSAPTGTKDSTGSPFWNATAACCNFYNSTANDLSFLYELVNQIKTEYNIDANRVYVVGDSNGGFMALELAYRFPQIFTAVASVAGASHLISRSTPKTGVHVLQIQGTEDTSILYNGGSIQNNTYPGVQASTTQWANYNKCSLVDASIGFKDLFPGLKGSETEVLSYKNGCSIDGSVELWSVLGGGHGLGRPVDVSNMLEVVDWLFSKAKSDWPSQYNGVAPPSYLELEINNIGSFHQRDNFIYTCIRALQNGQLSEVNGHSRFDVGFSISSLSDGRIRAVKSRPFNLKNLLTKFSEPPDCSGSFEINDGVYSDILLVGTDIFEVNFKVMDSSSLELVLLSMTKLNSRP